MNRNHISLKILFSSLALCLFISCSVPKHYLFVGTYSNTGSKGIYVYSFNVKNGKVKHVSNTDSATNPSWITLSGDHKYLYAVNETNGLNPGRVSAYSFDNKKGELHFLNTTFSGGDDPCYVTASADNKWLAVANYSSGTVSVFPISDNGNVQPYTQLIYDSVYRPQGSIASPHAHETVFSPDEKFLLTPDLGLDSVIIYRFNSSASQPLQIPPAAFSGSLKGSGPRHIVFHPNKKFVYLMHEMSGTVTLYHFENGKLEQIQELPTFPEGFSGKKDGAEVMVSPDGKFLYTSNRGDINSISIFSIDPADGKLSFKGDQPTFGKAPRNFVIDPTGNYLLAANQNSDNIIIFKRNKETGLLTKLNKEIHLPKPVCLQIIPKE